MSRFLKVMIVLLAIAAMATPVMAEDMLSLGGQMRVRGYYSDFGNDTDTSSTLDHRLRIGGKLSIADGVSITFRTDVSEGGWGADNGFGRFGSVTAWDRAHLDLSNDQFAFRAGTQNFLWGNATIDAQETGMAFTVKGDVPVNVFFSLIDRNDTAAVAAVPATTVCVDVEGTCTPTTVPGTAAVDANNGSDAFLFGAQVAFGGAKVFVVNQQDGSLENAYVMGATYNATYDAIKVSAELDFFTGDDAVGGDAVGTQMFVDAGFAASEAMTVGGAVYYAMGADANETQYVAFGNGFNLWDPLNHGPLQNDALAVVISAPYNTFDYIDGAGAGVMAGQVYADFKASDALGFTTSLAYAVPEDDDNTDADSVLLLNVGATYALMANTSLATQVQYVDADLSGADSILSAGLALYVNF